VGTWRRGREGDAKWLQAHVSEPDRAEMCLDLCGSQAGQERLCFSCAFLTTFTKRSFRELWHICFLEITCNQNLVATDFLFHWP